MRIRLLSVLALLLGVAVSPGSDAAPGPGFVKTDNVGYVASVPLEADTAGGRLLGKTFYVITAHGLTIYDVSNPTLPLPLGHLPLPFTPNQEREDVDTNGKILVVGQSYVGILFVVDVSNPRLPMLLSRISTANHTNTCALNCTFVYGSEGAITDLRDPKNPKEAGSSGVDGHDLTEVRPGLLATATNPITYLDVRKNPLRPTRLATGAMTSGGYYTHGVEWPRAGADRFLLAGTEEMLCSDEKLGSFQVFDTAGWQKSKRFKHVSSYYLEQGLQTEGKSPVNEFCGHWFKPHPKFRNGGIVAMAWYGFGIRFLKVTPKGQIEELGYFTPLPGHHSSVYWINDTTLYALDYTARGFDILTFDPKKKPGAFDPRVGRVRKAVDDGSDPVAPRPEGPAYLCPVPTTLPGQRLR
jgi:hypothetical protein